MPGGMRPSLRDPKEYPRDAQASFIESDSSMELVTPPASPGLPAITPDKRLSFPKYWQGQGNTTRYTKLILEEDLGFFAKAKMLIQKILPEELDITRVWTHQNEEDRKRLIDRVISAYPPFAKYEMAWPIFFYCRQHLSHLRRPLGWEFKDRRARRPAASTPPASSRSEAQRSTASSQSRTDDPRPSRASDRIRIRAGNTRQAQVPAGCPRTRVRLTDPTMSDATTPRRAQPAVPTGHAAPRAVAAENPAPSREGQDVLEFLTSVDGTFSYLLDRFLVAGVTSRARLLTVAQWADKDEFLLKELRLNAFERRLITDGLVKLAR
ncbi:hypothetical protein C2E23DRAFT_97788 [Lenzites betulinus]|nr:hypothetical protein C2E23DRAFT_97788 [Lenzites betulinus]